MRMRTTLALLLCCAAWQSVVAQAPIYYASGDDRGALSPAYRRLPQTHPSAWANEANPPRRAERVQAETSQWGSPSAASDAQGQPPKEAVLPNDHGQRFREYDLRPYTSQFADAPAPQQAIIEWIQRETGTDLWFNEPLGFMCASRDTLKVYHAPEVQDVVSDVLDQFVSGPADRLFFRVFLVSVAGTDWRAEARPMLTPVSVQSPGLDAWLLSKEKAIVLYHQLKRRDDFGAHHSSPVVVANGQTAEISPAHRQFVYAREFTGAGHGYYGPPAELGELKEGCQLQLSPLMSRDESVVDAVIKLKVSRVEKLHPVRVKLPQRAREAEVHVPQTTSWQLHERFRWPTNQAIVLSAGVVAPPTSQLGPTASTVGISDSPAGVAPSMPATAGSLEFDGSQRRETLLFIWYAGKSFEDGAIGRY